MEEITSLQGYILTRLDGLKDMLTEQHRILERLAAGQKELLAAVEASADSRLTKLLQYWPLIVSSAVKHVLTVLTIGVMIRQGADATSVMDAILKMLP